MYAFLICDSALFKLAIFDNLVIMGSQNAGLAAL